MVLKLLLYGVFLIAVASCPALAQPVLPDIAGTAGRGSVTLNWQCQYNTIKAISVLRATDSNAGYSLIGYVEQTDKGIQTFKDIHPLTGFNCYKLAIEFKTGLTWRSNHLCLRVENYSTESEKKLLPADKAEVQKQDITITEPASKQTDAGTQPVTLKLKMPPLPDDTIDITATNVTSRYCTADARSGNIILRLPADLERFSYSIKFFDLQNHLITEVPHIGTAALIFDKRNFQHRKYIRFVLRKDGVELEEGWLLMP